jgi:hypothetical protein
MSRSVLTAPKSILSLWLTACGASTALPAEPELGPTSSTTTDTPVMGATATAPATPQPANDPATPNLDTGTGTTNPQVSVPVTAVEPPAAAPALGSACPALDTTSAVRFSDEQRVLPDARCIDISTVSTLSALSSPLNEVWQEQVLMRADAYDSVDGPWQLERLAGSEVLASNAAGEQALLNFGLYTGVCYFDQARERGLQIRDVWGTEALACDGEQCRVVNMPASGLLDLDEPRFVLADEGYNQLFRDEAYDLSLASDSQVVHLCGGLKSDSTGGVWDVAWEIQAEIALEDYLPPVHSTCDAPDRLFLHDVISAPYPSVVFGVRSARPFLFTDRPDDLSATLKLDEPRCEPLAEGLEILDGQHARFLEGPHIGTELIAFLTPTEVRGYIHRVGLR